MIHFTVGDIEYSLKQNLNEITVKEYFEIVKIQDEKCAKPLVKSSVIDTSKLPVEYYNYDEEPAYFKWNKINRTINLLSGLPLEILEEYYELGDKLFEHVNLTELLPVWKTHIDYKIVTEKVAYDKGGVTKYKNLDSKVESDYVWTYDKAEDWCFQQWVDCENGSRISLYYPFVISVYKKKKGSSAKRKYDRSLPSFESDLEFWLNEPASENINTIINVLNEMSEIRKYFKWIYEVESAFAEPRKPTETIYLEDAGWNDVVVSLSETNAFNSAKGTLNGVRTANCVEVLEFLNWKRGKAFAEYEDYKLEEQLKNFPNGCAIG
jgi:hypothetical protein